MESGGGSGDFLPPEPLGPEPELRDAPPAQQPQPAPRQAQAGWQPPPASQSQQGWHQPPASWQPAPPGWQPAPRGYVPAPSEPDNGAAVAGFVTSVAAGALLVMSFGFMGVITLIAAPFGIYFSRKGKRAVADGTTRKHGGLAQAGFVIGIVVLVLSVVAVVGLIVFIVAAANDANDPGGGGGGFMTAAALVLMARRGA